MSIRNSPGVYSVLRGGEVEGGRGEGGRGEGGRGEGGREGGRWGGREGGREGGRKGGREGWKWRKGGRSQLTEHSSNEYSLDLLQYGASFL